MNVVVASIHMQAYLAQDGGAHHDADQDRVSLGAPGPDLRGERVRRPSRAKTTPQIYSIIWQPSKPELLVPYLPPGD